MPIPFGVGVGDFIAVAGLIRDIKTALQDSGGAKDDYQELERELELLELALGAVKSLTGPPHRQAEITAIKLVALSCRRTLDSFYSSIKNYGKNLSVTSRAGKLRASGNMVRWSLFMQADVVKLRTYLSAHVGNLNTLISAEILKTSRENADRAEEHHDYLKVAVEDGWKQSRAMILHAAEKADNNQRVIEENFTTSLTTLARLEGLVQVGSSIVEQVTEKLDNGVLPTIETLVQTTNGLHAGHNEMMRTLEARLPQPDSRFTWAQAPIHLEDALGRWIIVPSEYDYDMLEAVIVAKFRKGPGKEKVHSGDFELFNSFDSEHIIDAETVESTGLIPGMRITMAIIIGQYAVERPTPRCANPCCKSQKFRAAEQGGQICLRCNTWFDRSSKVLCQPLRPVGQELPRERHIQTEGWF